jgi:membrane fusion protein (multidrug efflux system)
VNVIGYVVKNSLLKTKIYSSGTLLANEEVQLKPEAGGRLISIYFKEGTKINKGSLLAKINDADLQAQLKKVELQYELAKQKEIRAKGMLAVQGLSEEEYDMAANQVKTLAADIDYLKSQIYKTELRAPFDGSIGLKQISEGSIVSTSTILASMQQTDQLKLDFSIPEKYAAFVLRNDTVVFTVDSGSEKHIAFVDAIEPRIDMQTRNLLIRARYSNKNQALYPGSFARVELYSSKNKMALMVPTEAILPELKSKTIFVSRNGKAIPVKVDTGTRNAAQVEIISGLTEGDTIIVSGIMSLKPDDKLHFVEIKK